MADRPPLEVPPPTALHATGTRPSSRRPHLTDAFCDSCGVDAGPLHPDEASAWVWGHLAAEQSPPLGLPAVLSSVDDVARVCIAAGLDTNAADGWGVLGQPSVMATEDEDEQLSEVAIDPPGSDDTIAVLSRGCPAPLLWHAIQAARGGEPS